MTKKVVFFTVAALGHDAFGYLLNYHQCGPGYCYLDVVVAANGLCEPTLLEGNRQGSIGGSNIYMGLVLLHLHVVYASHGFSIGLIPTGA